MAFFLTLIASLSMIPRASSAPRRVPACIERLNPFDWVCDQNANAQMDPEIVSIAVRDVSTTSPDSWTLQFVDTVSEASSS